MSLFWFSSLSSSNVNVVVLDPNIFHILVLFLVLVLAPVLRLVLVLFPYLVHIHVLTSFPLSNKRVSYRSRENRPIRELYLPLPPPIRLTHPFLLPIRLTHTDPLFSDEAEVDRLMDIFSRFLRETFLGEGNSQVGKGWWLMIMMVIMMTMIMMMMMVDDDDG